MPAERKGHRSLERARGPFDEHPAALRSVIVYPPDDRPAVLVQVDREWYAGELRRWSLDPFGGWWGTVSWRPLPGAASVNTFPARRIWEDREDAHPWS